MSSLNNYLDLARTGFLSPSGQCKPFDQSADGYCRSEGGGIIILKSYARAVADGDMIYSVIRGTATNHGSSCSSNTTPDTEYQIDLYHRVLAIAELKSHEISYVEAHGTGTQAGDPVEMRGIRTVLGGANRPTMLSVGSIKANIGHTETAAGVAGVLKVVAMLQNRSIPPLAQHKLLNGKIPPLEPDRMVIDTKLRHWDVPHRAALVNSYGAAGSNASCVCSEPPRSKKEDHKPHDGEAYPIILSAASLASLQTYAAKLSSYLSRTKPLPGIGDVAFTLSERRKRFKYCLTGVSSTTEGIVQDLVVDEYSTSDKPVIFCFGGQGSEVTQLNESFWKEHATFKAFVEHCDLLLTDMGFPTVSPAISLPHSVPDIVTYQISHVVAQLAFAKCWVVSGLSVTGVVGHSLGELAALGFCEILSLEDCLRLVATRADLMRTLWGKDKGRMLAIHADERFVQHIIKTVAAALPGSTAEVACYNSPTHHVIAGDSDAMGFAETILENQKTVRFQRIKTSHAFHSALTKPILKSLEDVTSRLVWGKSKYPLEMCSAQPMDTATAFNPSEHAREPVYFEQAIKRLESRLGPSLWIEAGVNGPVISMVRGALRAPADHEFIKLTIDGITNPSRMLSQTTVKLWKLGFDVKPWHFFTSSDCPYKTVWLPPYQFDRSQLWLENVDRAKVLSNPTFAKGQQPEADQSLDASNCMVTPMKPLSELRVNHDFKIHTTADRFQRLTTGHCVLGQPMCPASLYLECVSMAFESLLDKVQQSKLVCARFDNVAFLAPLKMDVIRVVQLSMTTKSSADFLYEFTISSRTHESATSKAVIHCSGTVSAQAEIGLKSSTRLLSRAVRTFSRKDDLEKLARKRAYKLFSRVVDYKDIFQGIASICLGDSKAYAEISLPDRDVCSSKEGISMLSLRIALFKLQAFWQTVVMKSAKARFYWRPALRRSKSCYPPRQARQGSGRFLLRYHHQHTRKLNILATSTPSPLTTTWLRYSRDVTLIKPPLNA
jgi:acyl transferase domain-containing protein